MDLLCIASVCFSVHLSFSYSFTFNPLIFFSLVHFLSCALYLALFSLYVSLTLSVSPLFLYYSLYCSLFLSVSLFLVFPVLNVLACMPACLLISLTLCPTFLFTGPICPSLLSRPFPLRSCAPLNCWHMYGFGSVELSIGLGAGPSSPTGAGSRHGQDTSCGSNAIYAVAAGAAPAACTAVPSSEAGCQPAGTRPDSGHFQLTRGAKVIWLGETFLLSASIRRIAWRALAKQCTGHAMFVHQHGGSHWRTPAHRL